MSVQLRPFALALFCFFAVQLAAAAPADGPGTDREFKQGVPRLTAIAPKVSGENVKYGAKITCFPQLATCLDNQILVMVLTDEAGNEIESNMTPVSEDGEPLSSAKIITNASDEGSSTYCTYAELYAVSSNGRQILVASDTSSCLTIE